ncbi:MAG: CoB--CoM heterodisulfide reductase iron-sulfur subunit B family protein [Candidatus Thorarchaeota archaeon]
MTRYAFFPGCTIAGRLPEIEKSIRTVCERLSIDLVDLPFTCCPEPNSVRSFSSSVWLTLAARNLALAESNGLNIVTGCAGCLESLKMGLRDLENDDARKTVNKRLAAVDLEFTGEIDVLHLHQVLYDEIGIERLTEVVTNPLHRRVVTHSGCHLLRPQSLLMVDDAEAPTKLDELVRALGMEPVNYMDKTMCCGGSIRAVNRDVSYAILREKMKSIAMVEPDAIVVFCPTCYLSFKAGQKVVNRMFGTEYNFDVFYYTELLAQAMETPTDTSSTSTRATVAEN